MSRLDLRIGRILNVRRHPLAETMSIQEVDVGENAPRMVVSKLGGKTNLEEVKQDLFYIYFYNFICKHTFFSIYYHLILKYDFVHILKRI